MPARTQGHKSNDARHARTTSWSSGYQHLTQGSEPVDSAASHSQRRRRESTLSLASVNEDPCSSSAAAAAASPDVDTYYRSSSIDDPDMIRNTSMDLDGRGQQQQEHHVRSRSQSQAQVLALREQELPAGQLPVQSRLSEVTWMSLPRKSQLALLGLCRVFDFLQIASLQAYMFYQLKSFNENLSDSDVATQAGILQGAFTAAQFATAIPWGRVADAEWGGRRFVLLVGLLGTAFSCLGVAFSTSFAQAVFWRSFGGAINGTVGIIRTMIAENVKEKKYHSRAFLILPIGFNVASLFGPGEFIRIVRLIWRLFMNGLLICFSYGWYAV